MDIGATFDPFKYAAYFPEVGPPAFTRVFFKPGDGLRPLSAPAISRLPAGTLPWISHKDPVPVSALTAYWDQLAEHYPGRKLRWTYHHEAAGANAPDRANYLSYWLELAAAAKDYPGIEPVQIQTNYAMRWRVDTDWGKWLAPGITLGFDCYPLEHFRYEPPESMFALVEFAALTLGVSWGIPELGADARAGQNRAAWLHDCVSYLGITGASFVGLWGAGATWEPKDPDTLNAFREIIAL